MTPGLRSAAYYLCSLSFPRSCPYSSSTALPVASAPRSMSSFFSPKRSREDEDADASRKKATAEDGVDGKFHIFCDLDGVLADFNGGVKKLTGKAPHELRSLQDMWRAVGRNRRFFEFLDWTEDGQELWNALRSFEKVDILTGVPNSRPDEVGYQKKVWCEKRLNRGKMNHVDMAARRPQRHAVVTGRKRKDCVNVISCWSKFKWQECKGRKCVLIDDTLKYKDAWEKAGGIFIHHTSSASSIEEMTRRGIIQPDEEGGIEDSTGDQPQPSHDESEDERAGTP